jgi:hypothetical protein
VILNAVIHGKYWYAESWPEKEVLIDEVMENLKPEEPGPWISAGEDACFMFAEGRHNSNTFDWWPDNYLRVAVNCRSGYGGLIWYVTGDRARGAGDDMHQYVWVSNNPNPPDFDPRVVADPGYPKFHDPRSTLPVEQIRAALIEFCRKGTGGRPECVQWVTGEMNGDRHDEFSRNGEK